jgi:hypothetical protein
MNIQELANETLVQKHRRLMRAKCKHKDLFISTFVSEAVAFREEHCFDCHMMWRTDLRAAN